ncbi:dynamin family protein [Allohahella sp. A8]|uniref:dynamin family protein n=1 Tax=Allohahella sp. A8 TaxID=3141461 RepID=UPI000C0B52F6|nr:GTPase [Hahellaceae bacterium]
MAVSTAVPGGRSNKGLSQQIEAYHAWKAAMIREIHHYRSWLESNDLASADIIGRLDHCSTVLREDKVTVALAGEFSRGKTELINALFFASFGQRMLPSHAGRTTMCPTEVFYDEAGSYLRLLPIETRESQVGIAELKLQSKHWHCIPLDGLSPDALKAGLEPLKQTKSVPIAQAVLLGFSLEGLDRDPEKNGHALIPAWRHALISLDNPLLKQGLRILDTPGLNALGSEPELTVSMLPKADAILFILAADTGVTASDMTLWNDHINKSEHKAGRYAILNKIDVLLEDIEGDEHAWRFIDNVREKTAMQLKLDPAHIVAMSAKQALIGRTQHDAERVAKSRIDELETLLADQILNRREQVIQDSVMQDVLSMIHNSQAVLRDRRDMLEDRLEKFRASTVSKDFLGDLSLKTQEDYDYYYKQLFTLRSSRRLMKSQAAILNSMIEPQRFDAYVTETRIRLMNAWTTFGMGSAIDDFYTSIEDDLKNLKYEAILAQRMIDSIYKRYTTEARNRHLKPAYLKVDRQIKALESLREQAKSFKRSPSSLMTEQTIFIKRFLQTLVAEARRLYDEIRHEVARWPHEALLPIFQHTTDQKQMLETQIARLKELAQSASVGRNQIERIEAMSTDLLHQQKALERIEKKLRRPAPQALRSVVTRLPSVVPVASSR